LESDPYSSQILSFIVLLFFSAFFAGAETAFFAINEMLTQKLLDENTATGNRVLRLRRKPRQLLVTLLMGNTLVNVSAATIAAVLTTRLSIQIGLHPNIGMLLNVIVVTFLILVLSEISPKVIAVKSPIRFAKRTSFLVLFFYFLFYPLTWVLDHVMNFFTRSFGLSENDRERLLESEEFQALLNIGYQEGTLEEDEKEMLTSIFEFGDTSVREIMVPRTDIICAEKNVSINELVQLVKENGHTRIPIFDESIDVILGIMNAKDLLPFISNSAKDFKIDELYRTPIFVPESKKIDDLLRQFQQNKQHLAIVVDEYGGTAGIVTLEDVIEEIVGEIRDEYDQEDKLYTKLNQSSYVVNAKIDIEKLNELIDIQIPDEDQYGTLGGYILEQTGSLPAIGYSFRKDDYLLTMKTVEKNRIVQVIIEFKPIENAEKE